MITVSTRTGNHADLAPGGVEHLDDAMLILVQWAHMLAQQRYHA